VDESEADRSNADRSITTSRSGMIEVMDLKEGKTQD
jgi:hypothetical protein